MKIVSYRLSWRCFSTGSLNSAPQFFARDCGAITERAKLGPGDLRMDAAAETAVGAGDDVFPADEFSERDEAIGHKFGVLDQIGGVADDTRDENLSGGELHVAPDFEFMFVTDVAGFNQVGLSIDTEHHIDDVT